ncbi:WXG100 family type VII secretion target [Rhodococcus sp. IEGM 1408]|nr:WXG100 family type VII secretion target [Rhodococcus sp. IEGM 1408]
MSILFAAAGGLIEAQDEAVAAALGKAAQEPAALQSLGLLGSLGSMSAMLDAADGQSSPGGYDRVGPEEVSGAPLARMVSGAQALEPGQFAQVSRRVSTVAAELQAAASNLQTGLGNALGSQWQGEFATQASTSVGSFTSSVTDLATVLEQVATKAGIAENGFSTTRSRITEESATFQATQVNTPGFGQVYGPPTRESVAAMATAQAAAEEQARAIVNTVYSPAVMDANLADLDIPTPYRVVSTSALGGASGLDLVSAWNVDGVVRPAVAGTPSEAAIAAAGGGRNAGAGTDAVGGAVGPGATTTTLPVARTDAATEQALLTSRGGGVDGGGAGAASAGHASAGGVNAGGLNATTTAAGSPFLPGTAANGQPAGAGAGAGAGGTRGIRNGNSNGNRNRGRGFGSAAGVLGGGGAAATGAGAARMGGAGTLAGFGTPGGPGAGGPISGAPGSGGLSGGAGSAGGPAGAFSSSSTGGAQAGRAGMMPMGVMGAAGAGQNDGRRGHTPASYLTNATNASAIVGNPVKVAPAVLGRTTPAEDVTAEPDRKADDPSPGRVIGRGFTGGGAAPR